MKGRNKVVVVLEVLVMRDFKGIINQSDFAWLQLDIEFPYKEMLKEAENIRDMFVLHRSEDTYGSIKHKNWYSLCIHGIDSQKTDHYESYGYHNHDTVPYVWTEAAKKCPITTEFFKYTFPHTKYFRIRFMLVDPKGYIFPHSDGTPNHLSPINFSLNQPKECYLKIEKYGYVPFEAGKCFILNVLPIHAVINKSDEPRYHMIMHGSFGIPEFKELILKSYEKYGSK